MAHFDTRQSNSDSSLKHYLSLNPVSPSSKWKSYHRQQLDQDTAPGDPRPLGILSIMHRSTALLVSDSFSSLYLSLESSHVLGNEWGTVFLDHNYLIIYWDNNGQSPECSWINKCVAAWVKDSHWFLPLSQRCTPVWLKEEGVGCEHFVRSCI